MPYDSAFAMGTFEDHGWPCERLYMRVGIDVIICIC